MAARDFTYFTFLKDLSSPRLTTGVKLAKDPPVLALAAALLGCVALNGSASAQSIVTATVDVGSGGDTGQFTSLATVSGTPAIAYYNVTDGLLMFARSTNVNGAGTWTISVVDNGPYVGQSASMTVVNGNRAIS